MSHVRFTGPPQGPGLRWTRLGSNGFGAVVTGLKPQDRVNFFKSKLLSVRLDTFACVFTRKPF